MSHWLSRRHPRYIRSLVYMLQASEYNIGDFFRWHERVENFSNVEKRGRLIFTLKAKLLYTVGWIAVFVALGAAGFVFLNVESPWRYLFSAILVLETPLIAFSALLIVLVLLRFVQTPIEWLAMTHARRRLLAHKGTKIAIAGSYGKTSTREILKTVLSEGKNVAAPGGSHNTPLSIAAFIRKLKGDEDVLIFELGEYYPGDVRKLARTIRPDWGVITGVNEAHLEKFKTLEDTESTIFELAENCESSNLYINGENERAREHAENDTIMYTRDGAGSWRIENAKTDLDGTTFQLSKNDAVFKVRTSLLGLHMLGPLALAADIASRLGLSDASIVAGIEKTKPFSHRLEPKKWADGVTFLDDSYNGNPDGVRAVITFLASLPGRRFYVTPGLVEIGERVKEVHEEIGRELTKAGIPKVTLIRNSVTPHIDTGLRTAGFKGEVLWYDDMPHCLAALHALSLPGDIILVQNDWPDQYA